MTTASDSRRRWLANVGSGYADALVGAVVYICLTPLLIARLGVEAYAAWLLGYAITYYLNFLDLGFGPAQVRLHARLEARGRRGLAERLVATTSVALAVAGLVAAAVGTLLALSPATGWLDVQAGIAADFRLLLALLAVNLLVAIPGSALENIYEGLQRFDLANLRSIAVRIVTALAQLALVLTGYGIVELAAVTVLASCVTIVIDLLVIRRLCPGLLEVEARFDMAIWRRIRHFVLWSSADDLVDEGTVNLDELLIAALLPLGLLTPYALCVTIAGSLLVIVQPIVATLFPMAATLQAGRERERLRRLLLLGSKGLLAIALPAAIFLCIYGAALVAWWVPEIAAEVTRPLMLLVVLDGLLTVYLATSSALLLAFNRVRAVVTLRLAQVGLQVTLIVLLAPPLGLLGVALAVLIANVSVGLLFELPLVCRLLGCSLPSFTAGTLLRLVLAAAPAATIAWWMTDRVSSLADIAAMGIVVALTYAAGAWMVGTTAEERADLLQLGQSLRRSPAAT